jgi:UDP-N-acetylglucosamine 2-epimerase (non-hydrolysing)
VAVFVGTRADLGPLSPVLSALDGASDVDLVVLTGVAFTARSLAAALPPSGEPWEPRVRALAGRLDRVAAASMLAHGPRLAAGTGDVLLRERPDVLVVLGDRWELLSVVPAAVLAGVPVVHLHGGEVTEGAVDERVRHAVTKLADQHCVASADAAARVRQLGEPADRVHVTGAPGLDRVAAADPADDAALAALVGGPVEHPLALFTYHPPTAETAAPVGEWVVEALLATLEHCRTVVVTHPGMDAGRDEILDALAARAEDPRVRVVESLGAAYPSVLGAVDIVVGNSSSGIIEAATVHVPAVDVGARQRGRLRGANVLHADEGRAAVSAAVARALTPEHRALAAATANPYGAGDAAARVLDIVRGAPGTPRTKPFVDLEERA